jgi:hypothetical protein
VTRSYNIQDTVFEIESLARLTPDWDGEGAMPPTAHAVDAAKQVLEQAACSAQEKGVPWKAPRCGAAEMAELTCAGALK